LQNKEVEIKELLNILKRKYKIIFGITFLIFIISILINFFVMGIDYNAKVKLTVGNINSAKIGKDSTKMYQSIIKSYLGNDIERKMIEKAIDNSKLNVNTDDVIKNITIDPSVYSSTFDIDYTNKDKNQAIDVVEAVAATMINDGTEYSKKYGDITNVNMGERLFCSKKAVINQRALNVVLITGIGFVLVLGIVFLREINNDKNKIGGLEK
jgi:capsular polysaccharide biosynthesis protein